MIVVLQQLTNKLICADFLSGQLAIASGRLHGDPVGVGNVRRYYYSRWYWDAIVSETLRSSPDLVHWARHPFHGLT